RARGRFVLECRMQQGHEMALFAQDVDEIGEFRRQIEKETSLRGIPLINKWLKGPPGVVSFWRDPGCLPSIVAQVIDAVIDGDEVGLEPVEVEGILKKRFAKGISRNASIDDPDAPAGVMFPQHCLQLRRVSLRLRDLLSCGGRSAKAENP